MNLYIHLYPCLSLSCSSSSCLSGSIDLFSLSICLCTYLHAISSFVSFSIVVGGVICTFLSLFLSISLGMDLSIYLGMSSSVESCRSLFIPISESLLSLLFFNSSLSLHRSLHCKSTFFATSFASSLSSSLAFSKSRLLPSSSSSSILVLVRFSVGSNVSSLYLSTLSRCICLSIFSLSTSLSVLIFPFVFKLFD